MTPSATTLSSGAVTTASATLPPPSESVVSGPPGSDSGTVHTTGFAFAAEDVAAYYQTQGYACAPPQPSSKAVGFTVRTCQERDAAGRTRVIGLVTDQDGGLANAFASVQGNATETILAPINALDPLSGFLGATLGERDGGALLTWLASHLGDAYSETTSGPIKVATYTASADDHATLYVELANRAYLDAPPVTP